MTNKLTREEWKSLWGILWRLLLFGPILLPLGAALLFLVAGFVFVPPCYAFMAIVDGHVLRGIVVAAAWLVLFRLNRNLLRKMFEGLEYSGI
ncbi:MAG TPA: hypothetical protein VI454_03495 [Verrucomicrobiae bacterium]|jgi:hypothetical protein